MPATARHGAAQATHTTSRTTANVSYHLWQHCCWQDTIAGAFSSAFVKFFPRGLLQPSYHISFFFFACLQYYIRLLCMWVWINCDKNAAYSYCTSLLIHVVLCLLSALVSGGFSPSSTATSGFSSQGSNTLPCPSQPIAPNSPRSSTGKRRHRKKDHKSSRMANHTSSLFPHQKFNLYYIIYLILTK